MLLALFAGNMAMWGQISRTVSFDLNSRHESNYCLGANTNEFTLTIDTKLESIDSLQAYEVALRYDPSKIRILAASRLGTISRIIDQNNFFFKNPEKGLTEVTGYTGLGKNSPNLAGEGALFALRGQWIDSRCSDSTKITIEYFDAGFEFGIGPRFVKIDSSVLISNRVFDTVLTSVSMFGTPSFADTISHDQFVFKKNITREIVFGRSAGNDSITFYNMLSKNVKVMDRKIDSLHNVQSFTNDDVITFRKIDRGNVGYARIQYEMEINTVEDTSTQEFNTFLRSSTCDCAVRLDSLQTVITLLRNSKPDTIINSVVEDSLRSTQCTEFYDILGRFIESDCPNDESAKAIKRRKAFKLGNNYIQYIDSK